MKSIILDSTTKSITAVLAAPKTTNHPDFYASYSNAKLGIFSGYEFNLENNYGQMNGTTPVTIVSHPLTDYVKVIKTIIIHNSDTVSHTLTLRYLNNGVIRIICKVTLAPNETFSTAGSVYNEGRSWKTDLDQTFVSLVAANTFTEDQTAPDFIKTRSGEITRDGDDLIETIEKTGGRTITITRDGNGRIGSFTDGVHVWTFTRDVNDRIESWEVTEV